MRAEEDRGLADCCLTTCGRSPFLPWPLFPPGTIKSSFPNSLDPFGPLADLWELLGGAAAARRGRTPSVDKLKEPFRPSSAFPQRGPGEADLSALVPPSTDRGAQSARVMMQLII